MFCLLLTSGCTLRMACRRVACGSSVSLQLNWLCLAAGRAIRAPACELMVVVRELDMVGRRKRRRGHSKGGMGKMRMGGMASQKVEKEQSLEGHTRALSPPSYNTPRAIPVQTIVLSDTFEVHRCCGLHAA
jgi:hypothetical protein